MKLISWNVNGLRAILKKGFLEFTQKQNPDILCLQEIKAQPSQIELKIPGYQTIWNSAKRPGYSGTMILTKPDPIHVTYGLGMEKHDQEGRVITAEYPGFFLVNVYVPNAKRDLSRLAYRHKEWDADFLNYLKKLEKKKPVIFCGDLNVAHTEDDLANPDSNHKTHGFTDEERAGFSQYIKKGFLDTFREFKQGNGFYTWWSQFNRCRARNIGWRIDYFLISKSLRPRLKKAFILPDIMGSDHCPVGIELV